ncbi:MAG: hypothetical protein RBS34_00345 [Desulfofustis sp.]|jgi:hypothetical protein|nr:hypothetical protein [Desulfofustis sp.]
MSGAVDFETYFEQHATDGVLTDEAMARLLTGDMGETAATATADSGDAPTPAPETPGAKADDGPAATDPQAGDGKPGDAEGAEDGDGEAVILGKSGKNIIPYEKLVEAREEAKAAREANQALMQEMESIKATLAAMNSGQPEAGPANSGEGQPQAAGDSAASESSSADTDAELANLKEQLADLPEVVEYVERITKGPLQQIAALKQQVEMLQGQVQPVIKTAQENVVESHYKAIRDAHADADAIVDSKEFGEWMQKQPSFARDAYVQVLEHGTAGQIVEMFSAFKDATGFGKQSSPAPGNKAPVKEQPTPTSLSDIPAGSAAHHDEAESMMQMSTTALLQKMLNMDPTKINELLPKLV